MPAARLAVEKVAVVPEIVPVPRVVDPFWKVTVPDGDEPPASVAVRVTDWPAVGDVDELDSEIEGDALPTVTVIAPDVAVPLLLSPV